MPRRQSIIPWHCLPFVTSASAAAAALASSIGVFRTDTSGFTRGGRCSSAMSSAASDSTDWMKAESEAQNEVAVALTWLAPHWPLCCAAGMACAALAILPMWGTLAGRKNFSCASCSSRRWRLRIRGRTACRISQ
eukprot:5878654-Prymnesium_polylepis.2